MTPTEIIRQRLINQKILETSFKNSGEVVKWLGAVQAQDYAGAKWAVGQRLKASTDADIERAFNDGTILRTHVLRPTWHFVTPADIRWMLRFTAPRVIAAMRSQHRRLELNDAVFKRSTTILKKVLRGGKQLTRPQIRLFLQKAGIVTDESRFIHLMARAELDEVVCSGPRVEKQFTYALLDERAPEAKALKRDEALAELTLRYFTSHGPATTKDFAWWSGLTVTDVKAGLEMNTSKLTHEVIEGKLYWFAEISPWKKKNTPTALLLPNYDEFIVGYSDRSALYNEADSKETPRGNIIFNHTILVDGKVVGTWERSLKSGKVVVKKFFIRPLNKSHRQAIDLQMKRYGKFMGMAVP